ncbi:MAG: hypothetical protein J1E42_08655 [Akkermansiaceae bacterium]|nr:hypothetical protein [Akkermansiaceae bacterium]
MKQCITTLALAACAVPAGAATLSQQVDEWIDATKKAFVVYDNQNTFVRKVRFSWREQFQMAVVQPNGSNGQHLKQSASPYNQEFRRSWLSLTVDTRTKTTFRAWFRVGGLPDRETYSNGRTKRNFTYANFFELWVKQEITPVKGLSVQAGKIKSLFTTDYITSSAAIYCVERSILSQQFGQDSNWGIDLTYAPNKTDKVYLQLFANDRASASKSLSHPDVYRDGRGLKGEFGWEDRCYTIVGASHRYNVQESGYQQVSAQFMHDFNNAYHGKAPGANNYGLGFKDAISLGYDVKKDRLLVQTNLVAAFEQQGGNGTNNVGIQIQPVYSLTPHMDLVFRYVGMTGHGACKLGADRYICTQTTASGWVDSLHTFYLGADLYASAKDKDAAKMMLGVEYATARKGGSDCYNGWEFTTAFRWNF